MLGVVTHADTYGCRLNIVVSQLGYSTYQSSQLHQFDHYPSTMCSFLEFCDQANLVRSMSFQKRPL